MTSVEPAVEAIPLLTVTVDASERQSPRPLVLVVVAVADVGDVRVGVDHRNVVVLV